MQAPVFNYIYGIFYIFQETFFDTVPWMRKIKPFIVSWFGIHQVVVASQVVNEDDDEVQ